jgi:thiol-disulfide isomerase/thioredoxin
MALSQKQDKGVRNVLGIQNPIFPELQRGIGQGMAQGEIPDISKTLLNPVSSGKTLSEPKSKELAEYLFKHLDPNKPILISFTAKLCEPCKYVKEASRLFMEDPEFASVREKYNIVQINDLNDKDTFEFSYVDKNGKKVTKTIDEKPEFDNDFQKRFRPLFLDMATFGGRTAMTPTMGLIYKNQGQIGVKAYNVDPLLAIAKPNTPLEFGRSIAEKFSQDMSAENK